MTSYKKVLIVSPCLAMGGIERASVNTANGLVKLGIDVVFLSLFKKKHFFELSKDVTLLEPNRFNSKTLSLIKSIVWIRRKIIQDKPTHILAFNKFYGAIAALASFNTKTSLFISERSSPLYKWRLHLRIINKLAYTLNPPKGVISQTKIAMEYQKKYYPSSVKYKVIPNSVREITQPDTLNKKPYILAVGRLNDHLKGFDQLISALPYINLGEWRLLIAGGNGGDLESHAKELGLEDKITFLGKIKDIDRYYSEASIFVIPSRSEGFPNALCEAMAAGLPCVSFDFIAGPRDLINDGENGLIAENGNIKDLAVKVQLLIDNENLRTSLGLKAKKSVEKLSIDNIVDEIAEFVLAIKKKKD